MFLIKYVLFVCPCDFFKFVTFQFFESVDKSQMKKNILKLNSQNLWDKICTARQRWDVLSNVGVQIEVFWGLDY